MAVIQISAVQHRRGASGELPDALKDGEIGVTTDTGEIFMGAPNLPGIQGRKSYPYQNIKILTEFDVQRGIKGDVYYHGPLIGIKVPSTVTGTFSSVAPLFRHGLVDFANYDFSLSASNDTIKINGTIGVCVHPTDPNLSTINVIELARLNWSPAVGALLSRFKITSADPTGGDNGLTWLAFNNDFGSEITLCLSGREWTNPPL